PAATGPPKPRTPRGYRKSSIMPTDPSSASPRPPKKEPRMNCRRVASRSGREACAPGVVGLAETVRRVSRAWRQASPLSPMAGEAPMSGAGVRGGWFTTVGLLGLPAACAPLRDDLDDVPRRGQLHALAAEQRAEDRQHPVRGDKAGELRDHVIALRPCQPH